MTSNVDSLKFILPTNGFVYEEDVCQYVLCKPMLIPVKTIGYEKLEKMQKEAEEKLKTSENAKEK